MKADYPPNAQLLRGAGYHCDKVVVLSQAERETLLAAQQICQAAMKMRNLNDDSDEWTGCAFRTCNYAIDSIRNDGPWHIEAR